MRNNLLFILLMSVGLSLHAQEVNRCHTVEMMKKMDEANPGYINAVEQTFAAAKQTAQEKAGGQEVYRIPVVFHVVYKTANENIPDSVLYSQIEVLNEDYRRNNADTSDTRDEFKPFAADAKIEFYLAHTDPDGNWTNGIVRKQTSVDSWISFTSFEPDGIKQSSQDGDDAWNTDRYLNIWVGNLSFLGNPFILGFAYPPVGAPNWPGGQNAPTADLEGVVLHYEIVGRNNPLATGLLDATSRGRTCTHEVGHFLGLRHIWGDGGGFSGTDGCTVDDGIDDTPNAKDASQQTCNLNANTCVDSPVDYKDMIENYMDYSDEHCMNMFTQGQVDIIRSMLATTRNPLVQDFPAGIELDMVQNSVELFPNPTEGLINLNYTNPLLQLKHIEITDSYGRLINTISPVTSADVTIDMTENAAGIYFIRSVYQQGVIVSRVMKK